MTGDRLGRYLLEHGRVTGAQLDEARRTRSFFGGDLGTHLVRLGHLTDADLGRALSELSGTPCADAQLRRIEPDVLARLPREIAERHHVCPFEFDGTTLRVALRNPRDTLALSSVRNATGFDVEGWVASEHRLDQALRRHYGIRREGVEGLQVPMAGEAPLSPPTLPRRPPATAPREPEEAAPDGRSQEIGLDGLPLDADITELDAALYDVARGTGAATDDREAPDTDPRTEPASAAPNPGSGEPDEPPLPVHAVPDSRSVDPVQRLADRLDLAVDSNDVAIALIDFCRLRAARCAMFAATRDGLRCLAGRGRALNTDRIRRMEIPLDTGNVLDRALAADEFYLGPVPPTPGNKDLYSLLGGRLPPSILVVPIRLRGRLVAALYLDNDDAPITAPDLPLMRRVAGKTALAFEILLLRRKLRDL